MSDDYVTMMLREILQAQHVMHRKSGRGVPKERVKEKQSFVYYTVSSDNITSNVLGLHYLLLGILMGCCDELNKAPSSLCLSQFDHDKFLIKSLRSQGIISLTQYKDQQWNLTCSG